MRRRLLVLIGAATLVTAILVIPTLPVRRAAGQRQDLLARISTANRVRVHAEGPCHRGAGLGSVIAELDGHERARYEVSEVEPDADPRRGAIWRAQVVAYVVPDRSTVLRESEAMARLAKLREVKYLGWSIPGDK